MIALEPFLVSARLAAAVTSILLVLCPPLARLRLSTDKAFAALLESVAILPMVLPPTVLGFYFLAGLSPSSPVGAFLERRFGIRLLFTFPGLVLAGCIVCFPFMYQSLKAAMLSLTPASWRRAIPSGREGPRLSSACSFPISCPASWPARSSPSRMPSASSGSC